MDDRDKEIQGLRASLAASQRRCAEANRQARLARLAMVGLERERRQALHDLTEEQHYRKEQVARNAKALRDLDIAYDERARLLALLTLHYPAAIGQDPGGGKFNNVLYLLIAGKQAGWHLHPEQVQHFHGVPHAQVVYDGHTTQDKYATIDGRVRSACLLADREAQVAELIEASTDALERLVARHTGTGDQVYDD